MCSDKPRSAPATEARPLPVLSAETLARLPLFRGESAEGLEWLLDHCRCVRVRAGETLLNPLLTNECCYIVLDGRLAVCLDDDAETAHAWLEAGSCVGEMSIIEGAPPSAHIVVERDSDLLAIDGEVLWTLINRSHAVARNLLYTLSQRVRRDNQALVESFEQQRRHAESARIDPLTGLGNRRWLSEVFPRMVERCLHGGVPLSLLILDADHFKAYNDTHGHLAGDCALRALGEVISHNTRPTDAAARYGGEEFVIVMPDTDAGQAQRIAERLCDAVRACEISDSGRPLPGITVSIGLAALADHHDPVELLGAADAALYRAKEAGRDRIST